MIGSIILILERFQNKKSLAAITVVIVSEIQVKVLCSLFQDNPNNY